MKLKCERGSNSKIAVYSVEKMLNPVELKMCELRAVLSRFVKISQKINVQSNLGCVLMDNAFHFKDRYAMFIA